MPYAALLDVKSWEAEYLFLESAALLSGQLAHEELLGVAAVARIAAPVFDFHHATLVPVAGDAKALAEVERIDAQLLVHHYHKVIGGLVVHQQFAVAVGDDPSCRVLDASQEGIGVGVALEVIA